jgi:hypothetical protein
MAPKCEMTFEESEEIMEQLQRVRVPQSSRHEKFFIGDIVRWAYEATSDPSYGKLYLVIGFVSDKPGVFVTREMDNPYAVREFHMSQLYKV